MWLVCISNCEIGSSKNTLDHYKIRGTSLPSCAGLCRRNSRRPAFIPRSLYMDYIIISLCTSCTFSDIDSPCNSPLNDMVNIMVYLLGTNPYHSLFQFFLWCIHQSEIEQIFLCSARFWLIFLDFKWKCAESTGFPFRIDIWYIRI